MYKLELDYGNRVETTNHKYYYMALEWYSINSSSIVGFKMYNSNGELIPIEKVVYDNDWR